MNDTAVSTRAPVRFVPDDQKDRPENEQIAYLLKPAGVLDGPQWRQAMGRIGARFTPDDEMLRCVRRGLEAIGRPDLLPPVEAYEDAMAEGGVTPAMTADIEDVEEILIAGYPPYAARHAARRYYMDVAPIMTFRLHCVGWENVPDVQFTRNQDGIPWDVMDRLPDGHVEEAGDRAFELNILRKEEEKNSASPSPGASTEVTSQSAKDGPPKAPPRKGKAGASRKSAGMN